MKRILALTLVATLATTPVFAKPVWTSKNRDGSITVLSDDAEYEAWSRNYDREYEHRRRAERLEQELRRPRSLQIYDSRSGRTIDGAVE